MRGSGAEESISLPPGYVCIKGWRGGCMGCRLTQKHRHKRVDTKMTGGSGSCSLCVLCSPPADCLHG